MFQPVKEYAVRLMREGKDRMICIPEDFVLAGDDIIIRQDKDGVITIHPNSSEGREAMNRFNLFSEADFS